MEEPIKTKRSSNNQQEPVQSLVRTTNKRLKSVNKTPPPKELPEEIQIVKDIFNGIAQLKSSNKAIGNKEMFDQVKSAFGISPKDPLEFKNMKELVESSRVTLNKTGDVEAKEEAKHKINDFMQHSTKVSIIGHKYLDKFSTMIGLIAPLILFFNKNSNTAIPIGPLKPGGHHHSNVTDKQERKLPFDQLHNFV